MSTARPTARGRACSASGSFPCGCRNRRRRTDRCTGCCRGGFACCWPWAWPWPSISPVRASPRGPLGADPPPPPAAEQVPAAETASSGAIALEAKGYIIPVHQILVSPKVNGMIVRLPIQEGMRVRKGDMVAELEDTDYRADYERARASWKPPGKPCWNSSGDSARKRSPRPRPIWPSPRRSSIS